MPMPGPKSSGIEWPPRDKVWIWEGDRLFLRPAPPAILEPQRKRKRRKSRWQEKVPPREVSVVERLAVNEVRKLVDRYQTVTWQGWRDWRGELH